MPKPKIRKDGPFFTRIDLLLYVVIGSLAFSRCLFLGQAYFDNDLLAQFGPWRDFLRNQLAQGHFPLWNPYSFGGQPFFADLQNMMAYPPNYLTLPFSVPYGLSIFFFLHLIWSAVGMHLWLRSLGLSGSTSRIGALLFSFSGFFWLELIHPPVLAAFSWLPWIFLTLDSLAKDPKPRTGFYAGLAFAMLFLCGSFQVTLGALYGGGLYFLFRLMTRPALNPAQRKQMGLALALLAWGALPLLAQFIPTLEFSALTERRASLQAYENLDFDWSLRPTTLYQFFFPRFNLPTDKTMAEVVQSVKSSQEPGGNFLANAGYLGVVLPFFFLWAWRGKDKKFVLFWGIFTLVSLALCLGPSLPLHRRVFEFVPGFSLIKVPFRFIYLYVLGAIVLAGLGMEEFLKYLAQKQNLKKGLSIFVAYGSVLYLIALFRPSQNWREIAALSSAFVGLTLYGLVPSSKKIGSLIFQASLVLPLGLNGLSIFAPNPSSNFDLEKNSQSLPIFARKVLPNRVIFETRHMLYPIQVDGQRFLIPYPENSASALGFKNFGGYNPLNLLTRKDLNALSLPSLIKLGAVAGVLTDMDHGPLLGFKREFAPPYYFYHYQKLIRYVFGTSRIEVIPDATKRLQRLKEPTYDPYQTTLLSGPLPPDIAVKLSGQKIDLQYQIDQDGPNEQKFTILSRQNNLAVFTETMFPGWKAWVDGKPTPLYTADHALRSLYLPAGRHEVVFKFQPGWWKPILFGSFVWIFLTLVYWLYPRPKKVPRA